MSNHTVEKFDPKNHDPLKDPPPQGPGIPQVLEDKLDIVAVQLAKLNVNLLALMRLLLQLLLAILFALFLILAALAVININLLGILAALAALAGLLIALAFMLGSRIVRRAEKLYR